MTQRGFRRRIIIVTGSDEARAAVEDDFHHFRVQVLFMNQTVSHVIGETLRYPYTACPSAIHELGALDGKSMSSVASHVYRQTNARIHCTHLLDIAGLAIAAAARRIERRAYDAFIPDRVEGTTRAKLMRDEGEMLDWCVDLNSILAPAPFAGRNYREGFAQWARDTLTEDLAEAALVLRRALAISIGRTKNLDAQVHAAPTGNCFSQQPHRSASALRIRGSMRDFSDRPEDLCAADAAWLRAT